jgi:hypothetical protein
MESQKVLKHQNQRDSSSFDGEFVLLKEMRTAMNIMYLRHLREPEYVFRLSTPVNCSLCRVPMLLSIILIMQRFFSPLVHYREIFHKLQSEIENRGRPSKTEERPSNVRVRERVETNMQKIKGKNVNGHYYLSIE